MKIAHFGNISSYDGVAIREDRDLKFSVIVNDGLKRRSEQFKTFSTKIGPSGHLTMTDRRSTMVPSYMQSRLF